MHSELRNGDHVSAVLPVSSTVRQFLEENDFVANITYSDGETKYNGVIPSSIEEIAPWSFKDFAIFRISAAINQSDSFRHCLQFESGGDLYRLICAVVHSPGHYCAVTLREYDSTVTLLAFYENLFPFMLIYKIGKISLCLMTASSRN